MADTARIRMDITTAPAVSPSSGRASVAVSVDDVRTLTEKLPGVTYTLSSDSAQVVSFGTLSEASLVYVRVLSGGAVRVRGTGTYGSTQAWGADPTLYMDCRRVPITALDLTREAGVLTVVEVTLGKMS
jgi:hypothetical protein